MKAELPMLVMLFPRSILSNPLQSSNAVDPIVMDPPYSKISEVMLKQPLNAELPMLVTLLGMVRAETPRPDLNAWLPIFSTPCPSAIFVMLVQFPNARNSMVLIVSGRVTLVIPVEVKASCAMAVTGRPSIIAGMSTFPVDPAFLVMVTVPSTIV